MTRTGRNHQIATAQEYFIHRSADVQTTNIGKNTNIWQFSVILNGAEIGSGVNICSHCYIENDVIIGNHVTVKNGVCIFDSTTIEDDVFIGPNVTFTNDKWPRSKVFPKKFPRTVIKRGASVGGGSVLLPGIIIGEGAMIGSGSVVAKDVPPQAIVYGDAARIRTGLAK